MAEMTYREALRRALIEAMEEDDRVFVLGEDVNQYGGPYGVTRDLGNMFGDRRVRDTPIAEMAIAGFATGAAMAGLRPIAELMTINFALIAADAIINHAAKVRSMFGGHAEAPVVIRTVGGAGAQLAATHSQNFEAMFAHIPGMYVAMPATPYDAKGLLRTAILVEDPVLFIEHAKLYNLRGEVPEERYTIPLGRADVKRPGKDVTLIAYSAMVHVALEVARQLADRGIEAEVVDLRSIRPLDTETIVRSVKKTNRAVVIEEDWRSFGVGAEVAARIQEEAFEWLDAPVHRVAAEEVPMPYARKLELAALPSTEKVLATLRAMKIVHA
jgi:pyruvate dehydrogenase E1 component beta subunit